MQAALKQKDAAIIHFLLCSAYMHWPAVISLCFMSFYYAYTLKLMYVHCHPPAGKCKIPIETFHSHSFLLKPLFFEACYSFKQRHHN